MFFLIPNLKHQKYIHLTFIKFWCFTATFLFQGQILFSTNVNLLVKNYTQTHKFFSLSINVQLKQVAFKVLEA